VIEKQPIPLDKDKSSRSKHPQR